MSSTNSDFESAQSKYNDLMNKYTGNAGYQNSLTQAGKGAAVESESAGAQAQSQARQAGMSKAQAAAMGANNASEQYGKSFTDQQAKAADQGNNAVTNQGTAVTNEQTEGNNRYNKAWGNVGAGANLIGSAIKTATTISDERAKNAVKLTSTSDEQKGNAIAANSGYRPSGYTKESDTGLNKKKEMTTREKVEAVGDSLSSFKAPQVASDAMMKISYSLNKIKPRNFKDLVWKED